MSLPRRHLIAALAATTLTAGCSLQYNGAFGLNSKDRRTVEDYHKLMARQRLQLAAGKAGMSVTTGIEAGMDRPSDQPTAGPASFDDRDVQILNASAPASGAAAEGWQRVPSRRDSSGAMRLFGTRPGSRAGAQSPLDGTDNLWQVTFASQGGDFDPEVDRSGSSLVYASTQHREHADIYLKSVDGASVTQLTNDAARDEMPTFSPDGGQVAFTSNRTGNWDIFLVDVAGGQPVQITTDPSDEIAPSFSPDGRKMIFSAYGERSGQWEMVVIDVDNPARRKFLGFGLFAAWSPNGDKILFQRAREWGTHWFSVWTLDLVDGEAQRFTEIVACTNAAAIMPNWSPDGQHIVFSTVLNPGSDDQAAIPQQGDVWIVRADGTGRSNLTSSPYTNLQPVWASNGSILFVSNRSNEGREHIWSLRPDAALRVTSSTRQLARGTLVQQMPLATVSAPMDKQMGADDMLFMPPPPGPAETQELVMTEIES
jgi:TolB protein